MDDGETVDDDVWSLMRDLRGMELVDDYDHKDAGELGSEATEACESCGEFKLIQTEGQRVCMHCYVVQSRVIDTSAEWRYYGADDHKDGDPSRCGLPTNALLPKSSLGSVIGCKRGEHRDMKRIRMYQMWNSMPYWERTLHNVFDKLASSTTNHGISSKIVGDAKVLYKRASEKKISRGDNKEGLIASCIYFACLINKLPRSHKEIARMFHIDPVVLTKGVARFQTLMQINVDSSNPDDYIARFGSKLNMNFASLQECKAFAKKLDELEIVSENAPTSVAAGALYYYCIHKELNLTKKQIAEVCEVSEVTITKCYKRLVKHKNLLDL